MRGTWQGLLVLSLAVLGVAISCGSEDQKKKSRVQRPGEAGESSGGTSTGPSPEGGAGAVTHGGTGDTGSAGAAGAPTETGVGGQTNVNVGGEAGAASAGETGAGGAGGAGGAPAVLAVGFATFGTSLVRIDPDTADVTFVNTLRSADGLTTYSEVSIAYGGVPGQALIVTPRYDATANLPPPAVGTLDLCTGIVTGLIELNRGAGIVVRAIEGISRSPGGTWYVSTGDFPAGAQASVCNRLGTLDPATGEVVNLAATINTAQDDMDAIDFVGDALYGVDLATNTTSLELVTLSLATGAASILASPTFGANATPLRFAYDASRSKAFGWRLSDRNLVELSITTGQATPVGETHTEAQLGGAVINGLTFAPPPICN